MLRIAVDTTGGDLGPAPFVEAAAEFVREERAGTHEGSVLCVLIGDAALLPKPEHGLEIVHAPLRIEFAGHSLRSLLRTDLTHGLTRGLALVADHSVDVLVSGTDTRVLMPLARARLGMQAGVQRPAIIKQFASPAGQWWMLDLGANVQADAQQLCQFARLGAHFAGIALKRIPRVAVLNIGEEAGKGPANLSDAAELIRQESGLQWSGFLEPNRLFDGIADVVVTEGFTGNIALKAIEGTANRARAMIREQIARFPGWVQWLIARSSSLENALNPQGYNGALLAGLNGLVVKSHGAADASGVLSALCQARDIVRQSQAESAGLP